MRVASSPSPPAVETLLADLHSEATQALDDLRDLVHGIYPPILTDHGLVAAIDAKVSRLPVSVALDANADATRGRYPEPIETAAYFLVSEALTNALKHAQASQTRVHVAYKPNWLEIEVTDDGVGFDPAAATGTGLTGMRDRIEALGGSLSIASSPGAGTTVQARLPATRPGRAAPSASAMAMAASEPRGQ